MKRAAIALVFAFIAGGCGNSSQDAAASSSSAAAAASSGRKSSPASSDDKTPPVDKGKDGAENVELAETYANDVCACKDATCINKAGEKYQAASDKMYADKQIRTPTPEQKKKMDEASARMKECT